MESTHVKLEKTQIIENLIYQYYNPKPTKIQAFLAKIAFFVDNDGYLCQLFYVNLDHIDSQFLYHFQLFDNI